MAIHTEAIKEAELDSLEAVTDWIHDTQGSLQRIPVAGVLEHGAVFRDDEYFGDGEAFFHFNRYGLQSFCQRLGFRVDLLARLETPSLSSQVLNDLLAQRTVRESLGDDEFVVDERNGTIIGLVSRSYVTYPNTEFVDDITGLLRGMKQGEEFTFKEAYGINTELTLRFTSVKHHGIIGGFGGQGEDKTKLGLELRNTLVGNSSIRINYFLHRLICANGLMVPAANAVNRFFHSGGKETFHLRFNRCFNEVVRRISQLQELLTTLGSLNFEPDHLARTRSLTDSIFQIIPGSKQTIAEKERLFLRYPQDASAAERDRIRLEHDARMIGLIPTHFGGELSSQVFNSRYRDKVSMFDFLNIFTEFAKSKSPAQKLEIEERTGALAKFIAANARKL